MRMLTCAWRGIAVRRTMFFVLLAAYNLSGICCGQNTQQKNAQQIDKDKELVTKGTGDSIPFRFLPSSEQKKIRPQAKFHQYGTIKLDNHSGMYGKYVNGMMAIEEKHPGILVYNNISHDEDHTLNWRVEIYNETTTKLVKRLDLEDISPYSRKKYKGIQYGGYGGGDAGDIMPDENGTLNKLPPPNNYRTNNLVQISPGGHICVLHELHKLSGAMFVGYEATLVVYSPKGKKIYSLTAKHSIGSPYVSTDGKYLAYIYGTGKSDNFFDDNLGNLKVVELKSGKTLLHYTFESLEKIGNIVEVEKDGWLVITASSPFPDYSSNKIALLDINKRELLTLKISPAEWKSIVDNWVSYADLVQKHSFTVKKY